MTQTVTLKPESKRADILKLIEVIKTFDYSKILSVKVSEDKETRRDKQNRLLWKWHGEFCEFLYQSRGELVRTEVWHEKMVPEFLPSRPVKIQGKWFTPRVETKKLKVKEFADFLTRYEIEAAEEGCLFTRPDDLYFEAMMKGVDGG